MKLRKFGALFLALALTLSLCAVPATAAESDFVMEDGVLAKYTGAGGAVVIPDGVTAIGEYAFYDCTGLTSVTIPSGVTTIGGWSFHGCTELTSVIIPDSVTQIGGNTFDGTPWLKNLGELAVINHILLKYQGAGGAVTIPDGVTEIGKYAFRGCAGLTSVTIPNSVTAIGWGAFENCTGLTSVTIPDGVTEIDGSVFSGCTGLTNFTIPNDVTCISSGAFLGCTGLTSVTIPDGVTEIGEWAFKGCIGLTSVTIPGSVTEIDRSAFDDCTGLTSVIFPGSVSQTGVDAFAGTPWLKNLGEFAVVKRILLKYQGAGGAVTIPDGVTEIGSHAFQDCTGLTSVAIPNSVTTIGWCAFQGCTGLTSVTIPDSVTKIDGGAFLGCTGLTSITIPDGVTEIQDMAFYGCTGLTGVTIPDSVTQIYNDTFGSGITLYGGAGSYAQTYAEENGIPFVVGKAPAVPTAPATPTAYAAPQTVLVDGKEVQFTAYALKDAAGNMTNYFRVRDVASVLNGTAAQFAVTWDGAVNLKAGAAYTPDGSEMTTPFAGNQPYKQVAGDTLVSGAPKKLAAITLSDAKGNGYTYYKLRDLGDNLGFKVDWNGKNVTIDTTAA